MAWFFRKENGKGAAGADKKSLTLVFSSGHDLPIAKLNKVFERPALEANATPEGIVVKMSGDPEKMIKFLETLGGTITHTQTRRGKYHRFFIKNPPEEKQVGLEELQIDLWF